MLHRIIIQYLLQLGVMSVLWRVQDWNTLDFLLLTLKVLVSKQFIDTPSHNHIDQR